ncbi:hypothetical protein SAMN05216548_11479 [Faunimonas pinastri]|uniref:Uncharacterized protein n=1 Tax=Faunimonas pinastri TaxID=1855383 RepID=A0A1H9MW91_9HYPH|nr:hypothetical protein [Faunimonas pinastri]SER27974.1 hypothetical protein SAMN05216548_11479 [Faunimonas pinastri]
MKMVTAVGVIVSRNGITLFLEDGTSEVLPQENWRTQSIMERIAIPLATRHRAEIDLDEFSLAQKLAEMTQGAITMEAQPNGTVALKTSAAVIPDAAPLTKYVEEAAHGFGAEALAAFMDDFARIPHKHSADELLQFMRNGDLPIADDGSIVVYKFLTPHRDKPGVFVDTHTGKVEQRLGSRVSMPTEKVDDNRRTLCSTGLHVCNKNYGSYGTAVFLAKVRPADVIAVPSIETGKMRACAYHLVAELPKGVYQKVAGKISAIEDEEGRAIVAAVLAGNHIGVLEEVVVGGSTTQKGIEVQTTPVKATASKPKKSNFRRGFVETAARIEPKDVKAAVAAAVSGDMSAAITEAAKNERQKAPPVKQAPRVHSGKSAPKALAQDFVEAKGKPDIEAPAAPQTFATYEEKFAEAKRRHEAGESIRTIAKALKMDRESLSKNLKASSRSV